MKILLILPILFSSQLFACDVNGSADELYARFYHLFVQNTGKNKNGDKTGTARNLNERQAEIAYSCLIKSAEKDSCSAHYMLSLFYKNGNMGSSIPISKDENKSIEYKESAGKHCKTGA